MDKLSIKDLPLAGKKILMRVDFNVPFKDVPVKNVPLKHDRVIIDDTRIIASLESIKYIIKHNGSVILMSHLGRPKGEKNADFSLDICAKRLSHLLNTPVIMASDCIGKDVEKLAKSLKPKEILLLENLRFHEGEEHPENDPSFAKQLASMGDIYINDAFGSSHRKHSSTYTITKYFPKASLSGFLLDKEISFLGNNLKMPKRPFYAIIGGAKISTKIGVIINLIDKVDELFIGGGMSYTFAKAAGIDIGSSICEDNQMETVKAIIDKCFDKKVLLNLPLDRMIANDISENANIKIISYNQNIPNGWEGVDIGPQTIDAWSKKLLEAKTIFWNGPLGIFEIDKFSNGTKEIAKVLASSTATTIAGGGDSIAAINSLNLKNKFTHLSTGGGASLEYIEHGSLPGIDALTNK